MKQLLQILLNYFVTKHFYSNLKISDISSLYTFSDIELIKVSAWDFKYGDNIFNI